MRVTTSKSKNAESFYINYAFIDKNGKSTSRIYKKLGTLKDLSEKLHTDRDGVMAWAKEQAKIETEKYKNEMDDVVLRLSPSMRIKKDSPRVFNCGYLFLQSICSALRFDNICRNIRNHSSFEYNLEAILSDLVYARILQPSSKLSSYRYCQSLLEKPDYQLHDVYRALQVLADNMDYIQAEVYKNSNFLHNRNTKILYYDCTNYYFEIEEEKNDQKYGKSKEHRPNPIVGMGLFMDADGFPLAFGIYPGNQNEQKSLKPLEQTVIRDFECSEFVYCSDSGLGSENNKLLNDCGNRSYVITQSLKKLKSEYRDTALDPAQYRKLGSKKFIDLRDIDETDPAAFNSIYYKEVPVESKNLSETMIVTYSPKYKAYQRKIRQGQIERAEKMINSNGKMKKNRKNPTDPARFVGQVSVTKDGEAADETEFFLDEEKIENEQKYDGFYAVVTDMDGDVSQIIAINQRRWQIEECFRIMKTEFSARPVYLSRSDSIKANFLTCFLSLLVYRILENKLQNKFTVNQITETLRNMNLTDMEGHGYIPSYTRTELTDALHEIFGFRTDMQIIKKARMRSIIKESKSVKLR